MKKKGDQYKYTKQQEDEFKNLIITELSKGKSLLSIKKKHKNLPSRMHIYTWLNPHHANYDAEFNDNYVRSREDQADINAENVEEIANKLLKGEYDPASARVAIDAFKWAAGQKKPQKYGKRLDVTTKGEQITQQVTVFELPDNNRDNDNE